MKSIKTIIAMVIVSITIGFGISAQEAGTAAVVKPGFDVIDKAEFVEGDMKITYELTENHLDDRMNNLMIHYVFTKNDEIIEDSYHWLAPNTYDELKTAKDAYFEYIMDETKAYEIKKDSPDSYESIISSYCLMGKYFSYDSPFKIAVHLELLYTALNNMFSSEEY